MEIINTIIGLGASVMMPIIFFVVGLIFRMGIGKSFKAGMTVGVGFVGVNMVINLLLDNLGPAHIFANLGFSDKKPNPG